MKGRVIVVVAAVVAALAGSSFATAVPTDTAAKRTVVTVSMYEMGFKLSKRGVSRGTVVFRVVNDGQVEHDFRIKGVGTPMLGSDERATISVRLSKAGRFGYLCTVPGHAAAGMKGTLTVK